MHSFLRSTDEWEFFLEHVTQCENENCMSTIHKQHSGHRWHCFSIWIWCPQFSFNPSWQLHYVWKNNRLLLSIIIVMRLTKCGNIENYVYTFISIFGEIEQCQGYNWTIRMTWHFFVSIFSGHIPICSKKIWFQLYLFNKISTRIQFFPNKMILLENLCNYFENGCRLQTKLPIRIDVIDSTFFFFHLN